MSRPLLISLGLLFLGFCSGIGVGLYLGSSSATSGLTEGNENKSSGDSSDNATGQQRLEQNTILVSRIRELEKELSEQNDKNAAVSTDKIAFFKKFHNQLRVQAFDGTHVTPEMAEILGLSKEEKQAVEQRLSEIEKEMQKLQTDNTVKASQTANSLTLDIPADPQGDVLKGQLHDGLSADIGEERADFLMSGGGYEPLGPFAGFAEQKKEVEITWVQQNGQPVYTTKTSYFGPNGQAQGWSSGTGGDISPVYQKYLQTTSGP